MMWLWILLGVFVDQISKYWAVKSLSFFKFKPLIGQFVGCQLVYNFGAAYGILQYQRAFLVGFGIAALGLLLVFKKYFVRSVYTRHGYAWLLAGTIGNLIDRVVHGYVVDFFVIHIVPVFNVADVMIDVGIAFFLLDLFFHKKTI
jgi:signal peptidase II